MAKGNLFLGTASGKVGDVVMYRANGEQLSRVRNRRPRNPNSTKQAIQRAVQSTVSQLYSIGQTLFNHSFQGKRVGAENQREFMKLNNKILRSLVVNDINEGLVDAACAARVCAPGLSFCVPFVGAQVSNGTYDNHLFAYDAAVRGFKMPDPGESETITEWVQRIGLVPGDIYTFGAIGCDSESDTPRYSVDAGNQYASVYMPTFAYSQLMVKSGLGGEALARTLKFEDVFIQAGGSVDITYLSVRDDVSIDDLLTVGSDHGCIFCIRSRWDSDLRSTSFLEAGTTQMAYGLTSDHLLAAWRDKAGLDDVDLILDGSNFNGIDQGEGLVVSASVVSNVRGVTTWPTVRDQQVLNDDIDGDLVVSIVGSGITSAAFGIDPDDLRPEVVVNDGTAVVCSWDAAQVANHTFYLKLNGELYGKTLTFAD